MREVPANRTSMIMATHNHASVERLVDTMAELGLPPDHPSVHVAQIMGMSDRLSYALARSGYNAHKLVLFGDFFEIFPWMLRRLDENADMLSAMSLERKFLWREVRQRVWDYATSKSKSLQRPTKWGKKQEPMSQEEANKVAREALEFIKERRRRKRHAEIEAIKRAASTEK